MKITESEEAMNWPELQTAIEKSLQSTDLDLQHCGLVLLGCAFALFLIFISFKDFSIGACARSPLTT